MLNLEMQQSGLLALSPYNSLNTGIGSESWFETVLLSPGFEITREITSWWQRYQIELQCRYTARLMKRFGCFDQCTAEHFRVHSMPASIEEMTSQFLTSIQQSSDPLLSAVASFELSAINLPARASKDTIVYWDRNPNEVLVALDSSRALPRPEPNVRYRMQMGANLPGGFTCLREEIAAWTTSNSIAPLSNGAGLQLSAIQL
jgi:hypothetical protein